MTDIHENQSDHLSFHENQSDHPLAPPIRIVVHKDIEIQVEKANRPSMGDAIQTVRNIFIRTQNTLQKVGDIFHIPPPGA